VISAIRFKGLCAGAVVATLAAASAVCHAQSAWPARPIRMLVGFPAGGPTDVVARIVSEKLAPYKGTAPSLAVTGKKRIASLPEVRTLVEGDLPGFVVATWQGIFAPANVPPATLARVNAELVKAIKSPELRPKIEQQDMEPTAPGHVEFNKMYRDELARWTKAAKDAGLKAD
jgi:tripartite-type tricarboxylate transporter receptor subunit TctC